MPNNNLVALVILADPTTGGWITFTAHLAHSLERLGYNPVLFKITKKSEKSPRDFGRGLQYWNISHQDVINISRNFPTIITALGRSKRDYAEGLIRNSASIVIHDPTEITKEILELLAFANVITIRKTVHAVLKEQNIDSLVIPHPYLRSPEKLPDRIHNAVAYSRVDWDKNTHLIVEANQSLEADERIRIHGSLNRFYAYTKLDKIDADWANNYYGAWSSKESLWYGVGLAASARVTVDLSSIAGDGGGTQYSFLEAFDAGTPLIVNAKWLTGVEELDEISEAIAGTAADADELVAMVTNPITYNSSVAESILQEHDGLKVTQDLLANAGLTQRV